MFLIHLICFRESALNPRQRIRNLFWGRGCDLVAAANVASGVESLHHPPAPALHTCITRSMCTKESVNSFRLKLHWNSHDDRRWRIDQLQVLEGKWVRTSSLSDWGFQVSANKFDSILHHHHSFYVEISRNIRKIDLLICGAWISCKFMDRIACDEPREHAKSKVRTTLELPAKSLKRDGSNQDFGASVKDFSIKSSSERLVLKPNFEPWVKLLGLPLLTWMTLCINSQTHLLANSPRSVSRRLCGENSIARRWTITNGCVLTF